MSPGTGAIWLALLLGWSTLGVLAALLTWRRHAGDLSLGLGLLVHVPHWAAWAVFTQAVRAVVARTPSLDARGLVLLHTAMATIVVLLHSAWVATWDLVALGDRVDLAWGAVVVAHLSQSAAWEALGYFAVLGAAALVARTLPPHLDRPAPVPDGTAAADRVVVVRQGPASVRIPVERIGHLEAAGNYVRLHTDQGRYAVRTTLGSMASELGERFHRVHRSRIVNLDWVERLESRGRWDKRVVLKDGAAVAASQEGWRRLQAVLGRRPEG